MRSRCDNPNHVSASIYYDLDITYDVSWNNFTKFVADMGEAPLGAWLDRVDGAKGYSKGNCRWADNWEHAQNKSNMALNAASVAEIKKRFLVKQPYGAQRRFFLSLGEEFGVSWITIRHIYRGNTWCNIEAAV